jgi:molybdopterin-containing oxidoreductase family membrane subunit
MILGGFLAPAVMLALTRGRSVGWTVAAAVLVNVGMWLERYLIVVGSLSTPQTPAEVSSYWPTWIEWSILAAAVAGFALLIALFSKVVPMVSMSEMAKPEEGSRPVDAEVGEVVT